MEEIKIVELSSGSDAPNNVIYFRDYNRFTSSRPGSAYDAEHLVRVPDGNGYSTWDGMLFYNGALCEPISIQGKHALFSAKIGYDYKMIRLKIIEE